MKLAMITLSHQGGTILRKLQTAFPQADLFVHRCAEPSGDFIAFDKIFVLTKKIFTQYDGLIYVCPCGVVVRALEGNLRHKSKDPGVVVVDAGARYAVSLLGGHEGGANSLAVKVANVLDAEPVLSTTTEAVKNLTVGVGCRRNAAADDIADAVVEALKRVGRSTLEVRFIASADVKRYEKGLREAAEQLRIPLRFITSDEIRNSSGDFAHSEFVQQKVNLPAVAEPAALLSGRRSKLILPKTIINHITVAIAEENSSL